MVIFPVYYFYKARKSLCYMYKKCASSPDKDKVWYLTGENNRRSSKNYFRNAYQCVQWFGFRFDQHFISPDLGSNCLQKVTTRQQKSPLAARKELII